MLSSYWGVLQSSHNMRQNNRTVNLHTIVYCLSITNKIHLSVNADTFYFTSSIPTHFGSNQTTKREIISTEEKSLISIIAYTSFSVYSLHHIKNKCYSVIVGLVCVCVRVRACACACAHARVHVRVCVCVCVYIYIFKILKLKLKNICSLQ